MEQVDSNSHTHLFSNWIRFVVVRHQFNHLFLATCTGLSCVWHRAHSWLWSVRHWLLGTAHVWLTWELLSRGRDIVVRLFSRLFQ